MLTVGPTNRAEAEEYQKRIRRQFQDSVLAYGTRSQTSPYVGTQEGKEKLLGDPGQLAEPGTRTQGALTRVGDLATVGNVTQGVGLAAATALIGGVAPTAARLLTRLVAGKFTYDMAKGLYNLNQNYKKAVDSGDEATAKKIQGQAMVDIPLTVLAAAGTAFPPKFKPGTPENAFGRNAATTPKQAETLSSLVSVRGGKVDTLETANTALPDLKNEAAKQGVKLGDFEGREGNNLGLKVADGSVKAIESQFDTYAKPLLDNSVSGKPIADAIRAEVSDALRARAPETARRLDALADRLEGTTKLSDLIDQKAELNNELRSLYKKGTSDQIGSDIETKAWDAAAEAARKTIYDYVGSKAGVDPQALTDLMNREKALIDIRNDFELNKNLASSEAAKLNAKTAREKIIGTKGKFPTEWLGSRLLDVGLQKAMGMSPVDILNARFKDIFSTKGMAFRGVGTYQEPPQLPPSPGGVPPIGPNQLALPPGQYPAGPSPLGNQLALPPPSDITLHQPSLETPTHVVPATRLSGRDISTGRFKRFFGTSPEKAIEDVPLSQYPGILQQVYNAAKAKGTSPQVMNGILQDLKRAMERMPPKIEQIEPYLKEPYATGGTGGTPVPVPGGTSEATRLAPFNPEGPGGNYASSGQDIQKLEPYLNEPYATGRAGGAPVQPPSGQPEAARLAPFSPTGPGGNYAASRPNIEQMEPYLTEPYATGQIGGAPVTPPAGQPEGAAPFNPEGPGGNAPSDIVRKIQALHYSENPAIRELDPNLFGSHQYTSEARRVAKFPDIGQRVTFLGEKGKYGEQRITSKPNRYKAMVPSSDVYDLAKDPDKLLAKAVETAAKSGSFGMDAVLSHIEKLARDNGYKGTIDAQGVLRMWDKVPVEYDPRKGFVFSSPNVKENAMTITEAEKASHSAEHIQFMNDGIEAAKKYGFDVKASPAVGNWADGSENSVHMEIPRPEGYTDNEFASKVRAVGAEMGKTGNQKTVAIFREMESGADHFHVIEIPKGKMTTPEIAKVLDEHGIHDRTIHEKGNSTVISSIDKAKKLDTNFDAVAKALGAKEYSTYEGEGEFNGAETREKARAVFDNQIRSEAERSNQALPQGVRGDGVGGRQETGASKTNQIEPVPPGVPLSLEVWQRLTPEGKTMWKQMGEQINAARLSERAKEQQEGAAGIGLSPTGTPGQNALIEAAANLGIPEQIIDRFAGKKVGSEEGAKTDTDFFRQAKATLGPEANISQVAQEAQRLKTQGTLGARPRGFALKKKVGSEGGFARTDIPSVLAEGAGKIGDVFYSKMQKFAEEKLPNIMDAASVLSALKNAGATNDELNYSGIKEFLQGKDRVTKQEVLNHLQQNGLKVNETVKGGISTTEKAKLDAYDKRIMSSSDLSDAERSDYQKLSDRESIGRTTGTGTQYESWQLPGGKNYREMLLKLPDKSGFDIAANDVKLKAARDAWHTEVQNSGADSPQAIAARDKYSALVEATPTINPQQDFTGGHFNEPNILAHVRFNDRVDADGKKMLFLEELQSDWHQKGRQRGYETPENKATFDKDYSDYRDYRDSLTDKYGIDFYFKITPEERAKINALNDKLIQPKIGNRVPDAPFKKDWHELAMKRMIRYAAENGYDRIGWTTGDQQAQRYDLSKQVDEIRYQPVYGESSTTPSKYDVMVFPKGGEKAITKTLTPQEMEGFVGKEIAQKIINGEGKQFNSKGVKKLEGEQDLKVGGEGMKGFYDKILPDFMNKYGKKWGAKVGENTINTGQPQSERNLQQNLAGRLYHQDYDMLDEEDQKTVDEAVQKELTSKPAKVHSIDITPLMKREVLQKGQPISEQKLPASLPPKIRTLMGESA